MGGNTMPEARQTPRVENESITLHTLETFYATEDRECAAKRWPHGEVEAAFAIYRNAVDVGDHTTMASLLSEGGRGGNATYGFFHDRATYLEFLKDCWLEIIPNVSVWHIVDGGRIVDKWCETLPGTPPGGDRYDYFGLNELVYAGGGRFRLMFSIPDLFGMTVLYRRWCVDGQHEIYGDIYPGLSG